MFATIRHTFELMKVSWRVLMKDRELILFPVMAAFSILATAGIFAAVASRTGTLTRIDAVQAEVPGASIAPGDVVLGVTLLFLTTFIGIFFNSALVAAALERLRGGDPNVASGLRAAATHIPAIAGWAAIAATVGLVLQMARSRTEGFLGRIALAIVGGVWAYLTFFVVPVLVAEGIGPIAAIKRSTSLFRQTWGRQAASSFGFGLVYILAGLAAMLPTVVLFALHPFLGVAGGVFLFGIALGAVAAMEGIFKAALYEYANGENPLEFGRETLSSAYRAM